MNDLSVDLVKLIRPGNGMPLGSAQDIWDIAFTDGGRMPGNWEASVESAMNAAKARDWPLATYLAARCARERGIASLSEPDLRQRREFWVEVAAPIVADVPDVENNRSSSGSRSSAGKNGVQSKTPWGANSRSNSANALQARQPRSDAKCLQVGATLQLAVSRIKRVKLEPEQLGQVWDILQEPCRTKSGRERNQNLFSSLNRQFGLSYISGGWFRVLEYPLAGDRTKALLRAEARGWTKQQKQAAERIGETFLSQCAKAGQWEIVEMLLRAKVPCPDLTKEFDSILGENETVRQSWRCDLVATVGWWRRPLSVLELAAWQSEKCAEGIERFKGILETLVAQAYSMDLEGGKGFKPLVVAAAEISRWDIVSVLFDDDVVPTSIPVGADNFLHFLRSHSLNAPAEVVALAELRALMECTVHSNNLREYFKHLVAGEVVTKEMVPSRFTLTGPSKTILQPINKRGPSVLAVGLTLNSPAHTLGKMETVFVSITQEELENAAEETLRRESVVLCIDLDNRHAVTEDPDEGCWIVVRVLEEILRRGDRDSMQIVIPTNSIPTPAFIPTVPVSIKVVSPCCREPLADVHIRVAGRRMGSTSTNGILSFRLPVGRKYICSAPNIGNQEVQIVADPGAIGEGAAEIRKELVASGELHFFLTSNGGDKDFVKCSPNIIHLQQAIPDGARPFRGLVTIQGGAGSQAGGKPRINVSASDPKGACARQMRTIRLKPADGRPFAIDEEDYLGWFDELPNECFLALIHNGLPKRIGDLQSRGHANVVVSGNSNSSSGQLVLAAEVSQKTRILTPGRPRPCSARTSSQPRAATVRNLPPQRPLSEFSGKGLTVSNPSPYKIPSPAPVRPAPCRNNPRRDGGCCTNPLYWRDYHDAWR